MAKGRWRKREGHDLAKLNLTVAKRRGLKKAKAY